MATEDFPIRDKKTDDATLDVALFIAGAASAVGAVPGLIHGGEPLQAVIGELMLCVIASWLAIYSRGYVVQRDVLAPVRPGLRGQHSLRARVLARFR